MSMSIGGLDLPPLRAPREAFRPRLLLDQVLDYWPDCLYQDAAEAVTHPVAQIMQRDEAVDTQEFFLYRDEQSAAAWAQHGANGANDNTMLHFLLRPDPCDLRMTEITVVVGEFTSEVAVLYGALNSSLTQLSGATTKPGHAVRASIEAELRVAGCTLSRSDFYDLVDGVRQYLYGHWTEDELACHPHESLQFCAVVRTKLNAPVPDHLIMRAMLNRRKRGAKTRP
jgi:hypothetical protein